MTICGTPFCSPTELRRGNETVLLVEDDPAVRELGEQALLSLGYRVFEAANGVEALKRFKELDGVDLLITDVVMPKMGGRELARRLRELSPHTRVLFNSGYTLTPLNGPTCWRMEYFSCKCPLP
jgi:two-component system cell cycle sensor histidine kinase/response regulator CckA